MSRLSLRSLGPVLLISLCTLLLCAITAVSLFHQQATLTRELRTNVESRRAAFNLEVGVIDLLALERNRSANVVPAQNRVRNLIEALREYATEPEEMVLYPIITRNFAEYLQRQRHLPPRESPEYEEARRALTAWLNNDVLSHCTRFRQLDSEIIEDSVAQHEQILTRLAWGFALVSVLGGISGLVLGYGVARNLSRSIRRLQVQLRDTAGLLGPDLPEIVFTGDRGFDGLHSEIDNLSSRIEKVLRDLKQRDSEVQRAEQLAAVGQLAAGVGHEIRNPLTSIKMLVQSALEEANPKLDGDDLRIIDGEVRRMQRSLQTFLDFARPPRMQRGPVSVGSLLENVSELIRLRAEKQRVAVRVNVSEPRAVTGDGEQLRQVFVNLCLNSLDAMPKGGTLNMSVYRRDPNRIAIEVSDTGPGIAKSLLPRLFEPFASTKETGLGLGLVISKRIVEAHGGTIAAGNRAEGGASFQLTLPVESDHANGATG